jgi:hypothetical protein
VQLAGAVLVRDNVVADASIPVLVVESVAEPVAAIVLASGALQEALRTPDSLAGAKRPRAEASSANPTCFRCCEPHSRAEPCPLPFACGAATWATYGSPCCICREEFSVGPVDDRKQGTRILNFMDMGWCCVSCVVRLGLELELEPGLRV